MIRHLGLFLVAAIAIAQDTTPTFRSEVQLVRLLATVKDDYGKLIGSLKKEDFTVLDNGVLQTISLFERNTEQPLSIAILIDTSASTAKELPYELKSVTKFIQALVREGNPRDEAELYSFNWMVSQETNFTRRLEEIEKGLKKLKPEGGTSMYDAIHYASRDLDNREGRHVIILVTDGGDTTSSTKFQQALQDAHLADAVIYPVLVMPITNDAGRNIGGENALTVLAQSTGGKMFVPAVGEQLDQAFQDILRDLRTQYLIGYYPRNIPYSKDRYHRLKVTVKGQGLRVQTRGGYYGDSETKND